jgi:3D (Asp-Asp-Asp) domain-containing protein
MQRILACLATLAFAASASASAAQSLGADPIGDLIAETNPPAVLPLTGMNLRATLYHTGRRMNSRDSLGCPVSPMRTVAVDPSLVSRHSIIFIKETVGLPLGDGGVHDGYWYASDIGGAIKGQRIDLFTGQGAASMRPLEGLNLKVLTVARVGEFSGCPPVDGGVGTRVATAGQ